MAQKKRSRLYLTIGTAAVIGLAIVFAFWPRPLMVDIGKVVRKPMVVTIDEEGRTRVRDAYIVSTPIAGQLLRVEARAGDPVVAGETVVARMLPTNPSLLDIRTREQARATVTAAEAALRVARANLNKAIADKDLAFSNLERTRFLFSSNTVSIAALDRAKNEARAAEAAVEAAEASISMRSAEVENARALLINFEDRQLPAANVIIQSEEIPIYAPATGHILRVMQESATTLPSGAAIMEIGNIENDLEIVVELLSTDAVQISAGDKVIIEDWGGPKTMEGIVDRIDPWGFTKTSALGVEEQRVNAIIDFTNSEESRKNLGHGFRVEVRIIVWEDSNALVVPSNALFRDGADWAVFLVTNGVVAKSKVDIGRNNGIDAQVIDGLAAGDRIILYPSSGLTDGIRVEQRQVS